MAKPLTPLQANKFFAALSKDKELYLNMPHTGCFVRAEIICKKLEQMGVEPKVVHTKPQPHMLSSDIATKNEGEEKATLHKVVWNFHVAAAVDVADINGRVQTLVLDPAMFNAPETIYGWANKIKHNEIPLQAQDTVVLSGAKAKMQLDKYWQQSGHSNAKMFFAAQPDRFAGETILRFPSSWYRGQQQILNSIANKTNS